MNKIPFPVKMLLETTTRCNLRCIMCSVNIDPRIKAGGEWYGDINTEIFDRLKDVFPQVRRVALNAHGEPLLYPKFLESLALLKSHGILVDITSNAVLINDEIAEGIVKYGLDNLTVSMNAASEPLYSEIMRGAKLETVIKNIKMINEYKQDYSKIIPKIVFHFVGMRQNIHQLPAVIELAKDLGVEGVVVLALVEYPLVEGQSLIYHKEYSKKFFEESVRIAEKEKIELIIPSQYFHHQNSKSQIYKKRIGMIYKVLFDHKTRGILYNKIWSHMRHERNMETKTDRPIINMSVRDCYDPWTMCYIMQNGDIRPCCNLEQNMGNVLEQNFEEIWNGEKYNRLRSEISNGNLPKECANCITRQWTDSKKWHDNLWAMIMPE